MVAPCLLHTWLGSLAFPAPRSDKNGLVEDEESDVSVRSLAKCEKKVYFSVLSSTCWVPDTGDQQVNKRLCPGTATPEMNRCIYT